MAVGHVLVIGNIAYMLVVNDSYQEQGSTCWWQSEKPTWRRYMHLSIIRCLTITATSAATRWSFSAIVRIHFQRNISSPSRYTR